MFKGKRIIIASRHTGLVVRQIERSLVFYRDILGLDPINRLFEEGPFIDGLVGIPDTRLEWVKLKTPDNYIVELLQYHSPSVSRNDTMPIKTNSIGCPHLSFSVDNLDNAYAILCEKGFHCFSAPQKSPNGLVKSLYCHDPDGVIVELVEELDKQ